MTVDLYHAMIMRDGERKDFPIQLLHTRRGSIQLNESIDRDATAVGVLPVCPVECLFPTFHLARQKRKVKVLGDQGGSVRCSVGF
jgi:hypothetical protein